MPSRRSSLAALLGLVGCAQIVGLDDLRDDQDSAQGRDQFEPAGAAGASSLPGTDESPTDTFGPAANGGASTNGNSAANGGAPSSGSAQPASNVGPGGTSASSSMAGMAGSSPDTDTAGAAGLAGSAPTEGQNAANGLAGAGGGDMPGSPSGTSPGASCGIDADCATATCATAACRGGQCVTTSVAAPGTPCGSDLDDECTAPDTCDEQGVCQRNDEINGVCSGGNCVDGICILAPPSGCLVDAASSVPFSTSWRSVGRPDLYDGGCDTEGTPDYALVFTAPQTGRFRVTSAGLVDDVPYTGPGEPSGVPDGPADGDAVMTIVRGNCAGLDAQQLACNDDGPDGSFNSQLDIELAAGESVTVYLNELAQMGGGTGTVSVVALP